MPRISTDNYDTVASWNGSQDLFVVEQPDGTKVATPALLKQYVLDGVTETSEQYAVCSTARNIAAKTVTLAGFKLETGARISVRFTDTGTSNPASGNITLNVNGTGAKEIVDSHTNMTKVNYTYGWIFNGNLVNDFIYDGTYWVYMNRDNNTTYTSKAAASGGTATSLCTTGEKYTWNNKQSALTFDNVPTQNSNNPVKSGGVKTYADSVLDAINTYRSGDWTARKYNDGAFECWRHFEKSVAANTVDTTTHLGFPSEIISVPECVTIGLIAGGADLYAAHIERKTSTLVRLAIINRHTAAATIGVDVHVYGRWK